MNRWWLGGLTFAVLAACGEGGDGQGEDAPETDAAVTETDAEVPAPLDANAEAQDLAVATDAATCKNTRAADAHTAHAAVHRGIRRGGWTRTRATLSS
jgi:hypothetical protein